MSKQGIMFLALAQCMVSINIVSSKILLENSPFTFLLIVRFGLAALILFILHMIFSKKKETIRVVLSQLNKKDWLFILAQSLCAGVLFNSLMLYGLKYTDANIAGIITSALPAIIAFMSWLLLKEEFTWKTITAIIFATMGLLFIGFDKVTRSQLEMHSINGDLFVFISLIPEALYYVLCKLHPNRLPVFLISAIMNAINAMILVGFYVWVGPQAISINLSDSFGLLLLGLSSGLFYVFWFMGSKKVDGVMASISTAIMPLMTVILASIFLHESLSLLQLAGMGLILFSIINYARRT